MEFFLTLRGYTYSEQQSAPIDLAHLTRMAVSVGDRLIRLSDAEIYQLREDLLPILAKKGTFHSLHDSFQTWVDYFRDKEIKDLKHDFYLASIIGSLSGNKISLEIDMQPENFSDDEFKQKKDALKVYCRFGSITVYSSSENFLTELESLGFRNLQVRKGTLNQNDQVSEEKINTQDCINIKIESPTASEIVHCARLNAQYEFQK
jgi:hypothetical protein